MLALFVSKTHVYGSYKPPARQSLSPIEATSLIDPTSTEGLSPESSWIAAAAPVEIGAGPSDYQGVLPALILPLEVTPTVGDRIRNCFCAFDISTPRARYESEVSCKAPNDLPAAPETKRASCSPRMWDPYTPLEKRNDENQV